MKHMLGMAKPLAEWREGQERKSEMRTPNGKRLVSGTPILAARATEAWEAEIEAKVKAAGVRTPPAGTPARAAHDQLMAAFRMGKREFARVSEELLGKRPEGWPEPEETPMDRESEESYANYVGMLKAAKAGNVDELRELLSEAAVKRADS
jgi:hypothetical protein